MTDLPTIAYPDAGAFEAWLEANHATSPGVWMLIAKKGTGVATCTYAEAVDLALCFGWIDSLKKAHDATYFVQKFSPRRPRSIWSGINVEKAVALIEAGKMRPAGLREVDAAQADGRWQAAYAPQSKMVTPADLQAALDANPAAAAFCATLDGRNRYAILHRVTTAVKPETRAKRITDFVAMLADGRVLYP